MAVGVSLNDIQKIIGNKQEIPEGFLTTKQWAKELDVGEKTMLRMLGLLSESGCLEVGRVTSKNLAQQNVSVPAYKINVPKGK